MSTSNLQDDELLILGCQTPEQGWMCCVLRFENQLSAVRWTLNKLDRDHTVTHILCLCVYWIIGYKLQMLWSHFFPLPLLIPIAVLRVSADTEYWPATRARKKNTCIFKNIIFFQCFSISVFELLINAQIKTAWVDAIAQFDSQWINSSLVKVARIIDFCHIKR